MTWETDLDAVRSSVNAALAAKDRTIAEQAARIAALENATPDPEPEPEPPVVTPPVTPPTTPATFIGPSGKHTYPNVATPTTTHNVAATWSAISTQITACQSHTGVCKIAVAPGNLPAGAGAGSTASGALQNIGSTGKRIVITPRDGYGTVKVLGTKGIAFVGVKGIVLDRIDFSAASGVMFRNVENVGFGYSTVQTLLVTANGGGGVKDLAIVEIVAGPDQVNNVGYDRVQIKSASGFSVNGIKFIGSYFAPNYKPQGSSAHCDTIQFVTTSGSGTIQNIDIIDSALFQSADQGIMAGANGGGTLKNSAFFGGATSQLRYPMYSGGDPITLANVLHGTWQNVIADGIIVAGSINSSYTFASVTNSKSTQGTRGFAALGTVTKADIDALVPYPTQARLNTLWK